MKRKCSFILSEILSFYTAYAQRPRRWYMRSSVSATSRGEALTPAVPAGTWYASRTWLTKSKRVISRWRKRFTMRDQPSLILARPVLACAIDESPRGSATVNHVWRHSGHLLCQAPRLLMCFLRQRCPKTCPQHLVMPLSVADRSTRTAHSLPAPFFDRACWCCSYGSEQIGQLRESASRSARLMYGVMRAKGGTREAGLDSFEVGGAILTMGRGSRRMKREIRGRYWYGNVEAGRQLRRL